MPTRREPADTSPEIPTGVAPAQDVLSLLQIPGDFKQTAALYALAASADAAEIRRHIQDAQLIAKISDRQAALAVLFLRLSDLDPDGVLVHLYESGIKDRNSAIFTIFSNWAKVDLDQALARVGRLRTDRDRQTAHNAIVQAHDDPATLRRIVDRLPSGSAGQRATIGALFAKAHSDPAAALQAALRLTDRNARIGAIMNIASEWGKTDLSAALAAAQNIADPEARRSFRHNALTAAARQDPDRALDLLKGLGDRAERQVVVQAAFAELASQDPQRALFLAQGIDDGALRREALGSALTALANTDPHAAAAALARIDDLGLIQRYGYAIAGQYARVAPAEAMEWAATLDGSGTGLLHTVINTVAEVEPELALAYVTGLEPSIYQAQLLSNVLGVIARDAPARALAHADDLPPGQVRNQAMQMILNTWAQRDPIAAMDWALRRPAREQADLLANMAYQVANSDLELALGYAEHIEGPARDRWIGALIHQFAAQNPERAADWLRQYSNEAQYGNWLATVASQMLATDAAGALAVIDRIEDPEQYRMARNTVISGWVHRDPAAAAHWLSDQPPDETYPQLVQQVASNWHNYDRKAAVRWVEKLDTPELRDQGIAAIVGNGQLEPDEAARLIDRIGSEDARWRALQGHVSQMARYDPEGARTFLDRWAMSDERRQQIESMLSHYEQGW